MNAFADTSSIPVSVIIPCFNQGHYLAEAIDSVLGQDHRNLEVIVVDDGSSDLTRDVAGRYPTVKYAHQANQGLSAARNTGIDLSSGKYLVFLDADDWLLPGGIPANLAFLAQNKEAGFVSGSHRKVNASGQVIEKETALPGANPYLELLQGNYIGMHGAVMYPRWVFGRFRYDTSLKACEDYDLYLKIAREYPIVHHAACIAAYRIHNTNMSGSIPFMLGAVLNVLDRQQVNTEEEKKCLENGRSNWINYYCENLYRRLPAPLPAGSENGHEALAALRKYRPDLYGKYLKRYLTMNIKTFVRKNAPAPLLKGLRKYFGRKSGDAVKMPDRLKPYSTEFGYDRGGPVDRYYIENFLQRQALHIRGSVLEIGDNAYTMRFGGGRVEKSDVLHVDEYHPQATLTGDLSHAPHVPDNSFDCIVLTQTLHLIYHYQDALKTCYRILKPGGKLLLTVPGITSIDHGEWERTWFWSFTARSVTRMLAEVFPPAETAVETHGNVLVASAFLYGLGLPELKREQMDFHDPHYQVIITAVAAKPGLS
ncbi:glycosyltransferase involved in cell wall biosynthesis [Anseongella ginsenosidimutans]|uniref:Glycosyltransferase involved in cell wall biosynthesis n=1 Tax=Anseongella ginsenosidimutans TaxID=496056 RepID=A0A4R3KYJ6_9SPHI|nr:glycosyltransferase [Anseongella ginsenosidimutans]QEC51210.1 glycosyltransferase [Anseongella ginsenosidimutans]TCS90116.1 glycosyltransferase involved in cell wall biosynthesis [Anseongella ginsenosidimutans]